MSHSSPTPSDPIVAAPSANTGDVASTPLADALRASSIPLVNHSGIMTAEVFSSTPEEVAALLTTAGVFDLGWRGFLRCVGEDRVRWLNGMVTNSVSGLDENSGCYAFVLNAQGRIQGDLNIYRRADALWLETDRAQIGTLTEFLDHYIIMDDVALEPQPAWTAIGIAGPEAAARLAEAGLFAPNLSPMQLAEISWRDRPIVLVAAHSPRVPRYEIWLAADGALDLWSALSEVGLVACGANALEQLRILEGTPAYSIDITNRDLPQETNQTRALHFSKGCYLGQEIVERIRSRGMVHRTVHGFVLEGEVPAPQTPLLADDKPVGEISSAARISIPGVGERVLALGRHVRREELERQTALTANGKAANPSSLPFDFNSMAVQP